MSSNHPVFNISKSTPTTSTSNENTVSGNNTPIPSDLNSGSPLIKNILNRGTPTAQVSNSPEPSGSTAKFAPTLPAPLSSVSPTFVTSEFDSGKSDSKPGLIGLFDKFDINKSDTKLDHTSATEKASGLVDKADQSNESHGEDTKPEAVSSEKPIDNELEDEKYEENDEDLEHQRRIDAALGNLEMEDVRDLGGESNYPEQEGKEADETKQEEEQDHAQNQEQDQEQEHVHKEVAKQQTVTQNVTDLSETRILDKQAVVDEHSNSTELKENLLKDLELNDDELTSFTENLAQTAEEIPHSNIAATLAQANDPASVESKQSIQVDAKTSTGDDVPSSSSLDSTAVKHPHKRPLSKIDPVEQHQLSHKPFDFQNFLLQLKKKSAEPIVRYIRSLLVSFSRQAHTFTYEQKIKIITDFKVFISEKYTLYEPFASMDDIDLENSREGLEKLVMNRLYEFCFPSAIAKQAISNGQAVSKDLVKDDLVQDDSFSQSVEKFSWVNGTHLDVDLNDLHLQKGSNGLNFIEYAVLELNKINNYRAPRDKIICVLNLCKVIFGWLKVSKQDTNADSFVPILILVILKAKTDNLISNMHYIENYRGDEWLSHGETSYYLSSLQGAIAFIQNLSFDDLTISEEEYNAHIEAWEAQQKQISRERRRKREPNQDLIDLSDTQTGSNLSEPVSIQQPHPERPNEQGSLGLSPSTVLLNSAGIVSKSIANFLSPSPQPEAESIPHSPVNNNSPGIQDSHVDLQETPATKEAFETLLQMFPNIDKAILQDLVYIKHGNIDECVDTCLELVADA